MDRPLLISIGPKYETPMLVNGGRSETMRSRGNLLLTQLPSMVPAEDTVGQDFTRCYIGTSDPILSLQPRENMVSPTMAHLLVDVLE